MPGYNPLIRHVVNGEWVLFEMGPGASTYIRPLLPPDEVNARLRSELDRGNLHLEIWIPPDSSLARESAEALDTAGKFRSIVFQRADHAAQRIPVFAASFAELQSRWGARPSDVPLTTEAETAILTWAGRVFQMTARAFADLEDAVRMGRAALDPEILKVCSRALTDSFHYLRDLLVRFKETRRNEVGFSQHAVEAGDPMVDIISSAFVMTDTTRLTVDFLWALRHCPAAYAREVLLKFEPHNDALFDSHCRMSYASALLDLAQEPAQRTATIGLALEFLVREEAPIVREVLLEGLCDYFEVPGVREAVLASIMPNWATSRQPLDRLVRDSQTDTIPPALDSELRYYAWADDADIARLNIPIADPPLVRRRIQDLVRTLERRRAEVPDFELSIGDFVARSVRTNREMHSITHTFGFDSTTNTGGWTPWLSTRALLFDSKSAPAIGYVRLCETGETMNVASNIQCSPIAQLSANNEVPLSARSGLLPALLLTAIELARFRGETLPVSVNLGAFEYFCLGGGPELAGIPIERLAVTRA